jgi:hypothetical protein
MTAQRPLFHDSAEDAPHSAMQAAHLLIFHNICTRPACRPSVFTRGWLPPHARFAGRAARPRQPPCRRVATGACRRFASEPGRDARPRPPPQRQRSAREGRQARRSPHRCPSVRTHPAEAGALRCGHARQASMAASRDPNKCPFWPCPSAAAAGPGLVTPRQRTSGPCLRATMRTRHAGQSAGLQSANAGAEDMPSVELPDHGRTRGLEGPRRQRQPTRPAWPKQSSGPGRRLAA